MANQFDDLDAAWKSSEPAKAGGNFDPLPDGTEVSAFVTKQEFKLVGQKATPCVKLTFEVGVADEPSHVGRLVWHDLWLTAANAPYLKRDLGVLGWKGDRLSILTDPTDASLMHLGAKMKLGIEEYTDAHGVVKKKNIIRYFNETYKYTPPPAGSESHAPSGAPAEEDDLPF